MYSEVVRAQLEEEARPPFIPEVGQALHPAALALPDDLQRALIDKARDPSTVDGLTHRHYQYPARFSPLLVGQTIETFTAPGDMVLDPYVGGGTTLVEAYARGREAIGSDISSLATFVTSAKLSALTRDQADRFMDIAADVVGGIDMRAASTIGATYGRNHNHRES